MISYACKDLGEDCDWSASAETKEELWSKIRVHAIEVHNEKPDEYSDEIIALVEGAFKYS